MANSLSDQLLKAGLVDKKRHQKVQKQAQKQKKKVLHGNAAKNDEATRLALQAAAEKRERDRQLNLQQKQLAEEKAISAQIRQLIESNQRLDEGDVAYNFSDDNLIKTLYITERLQQQLSHGYLKIVKFEGSYALVPAAVAEKIALRDESYIIRQDVTKPDMKEDDPYADYQVPDDLMW